VRVDDTPTVPPDSLPKEEIEELEKEIEIVDAAERS